jgi:hypothetical protein
MPEQYFRAKAYRRVSKTTPRPDAEAGPYTEPASAADWAEQWLLTNGTPDESFVDLYFNGEPNIHSSIYLLTKNGQNGFGVLNSSHAKWPFEYMQGEGDVLMPGQEPFGRDTDEWLPGDSDEDETSDDADTMDLGADEKTSDKGGDDSEEMPEDEEDNEDEIDEDLDESDAGETGETDDDGGESDDEKEVSRMTIFGKFRGPKGWRKRAETDPEREQNVFSVRFGVLNATGHTTASQERDSRVEIRFIERDARRDAGELRIRVPEGVSFRDYGKWLVAEIPYKDRENDQ